MTSVVQRKKIAVPQKRKESKKKKNSSYFRPLWPFWASIGHLAINTCPQGVVLHFAVWPQSHFGNLSRGGVNKVYDDES